MTRKTLHPLLLLLPSCLISSETRDLRLDKDGDEVLVWDDCNDGDAAVGGAIPYAADVDGDGFGDPNTVDTNGCSATGNFVALGEEVDCDDADASVYPGAPELRDGQPNQCVGGAVSSLSEAAAAAATDFDDKWEVLRLGERVTDADGIDLGRFIATPLVLGEYSRLGEDAVQAGRWLAVSSSKHVVLLEPVWDPLAVDAGREEWPLQVDSVGALITQEHKGGADALAAGRWAQLSYLVVGAPYWDESGRVFLHNSESFVGLDQGTVADARYVLSAEASASGSELGYAVVMDDLNGDGGVDLVVGSPGENRVSVVWHDEIFAMDTRPEILATDTIIEGTGRWGHALAIADLDGDGDQELIVGAPEAIVGAGDEGLVSILSVNQLSATELQTLTGELGGQFGSALAAQDADADDDSDLMVGEPGLDRVTLWAGSEDLQAWTQPNPGGAYGQAGTGLGQAVAWGPNLNGEGPLEVVCGAPTAGFGAGAVWIVDGERLNVQGRGSIDEDIALVQLKGARAAGLGSSVTLLNDLDGDAVPELALGAPGSDTIWLLRGAWW